LFRARHVVSGLRPDVEGGLRPPGESMRSAADERSTGAEEEYAA
jgi:hypothetical protein